MGLLISFVRKGECRAPPWAAAVAAWLPPLSKGLETCAAAARAATAGRTGHAVQSSAEGVADGRRGRIYRTAQ